MDEVRKGDPSSRQKMRRRNIHSYQQLPKKHSSGTMPKLRWISFGSWWCINRVNESEVTACGVSSILIDRSLEWIEWGSITRKSILPGCFFYLPTSRQRPGISSQQIFQILGFSPIRKYMYYLLKSCFVHFSSTSVQLQFNFSPTSVQLQSNFSPESNDAYVH